MYQLEQYQNFVLGNIASILVYLLNHYYTEIYIAIFLIFFCFNFIKIIFNWALSAKSDKGLYSLQKRYFIRHGAFPGKIITSQFNVFSFMK